MGLSTPTTNLASLLCATFRAQTTSTTTLPRSLEGRGGAFDTPKVKCPPDRGSSDWVTGSPASSFSSISLSPPSFPSSPASKISPPVIATQPIRVSNFSQPRSIPSRSNSQQSTPPLTPDDGSDDSGASLAAPHQEKDALDFLVTLFPRGGLSALPHSKAVSISAPNLGSDFNGVILDLPGSVKTLYVDGKSAESVSLRESIVALLDLADESLECNALVIVLERSSPNLKALLHSLMYVGGAVVTKPPFEVDPVFILVGLEI